MLIVGGEYKPGAWLLGGQYGAEKTTQQVIYAGPGPVLKVKTTFEVIYGGYDFIPSKNTTLALLATYSSFGFEQEDNESYSYGEYVVKAKYTTSSLGVGVKLGQTFGRFNMELLYLYGLDDNFKMKLSYKNVDYEDPDYNDEGTFTDKFDGDFRGYFIKLGYRVTDNLNLRLSYRKMKFDTKVIDVDYEYFHSFDFKTDGWGLGIEYYF